MTIKNADKSAMPSQALGTDGLPTHEAEFGLTKREMMAMHTAAGFAADKDVRPSNIAKLATEVADLLLAELEKSQ